MSRNGTAVIVDDHENIRAVLSNQLERAGFTVVSAASVAEAEPLLKQHRVTLIMLDIVMPEKDGFHLLANQRLEHAQPVVIVMTGGGNEMSPEFIEHYSKALKAHRVMFKPFSEETLKNTLSELSFAI